MTNGYSFRSLLTAISLFVISAATIAQILPGFPLEATVNEKQVVELKWSKPADTLSHIYTVYRAQLPVNKFVDTNVLYDSILTTEDTMSVDTPKVTVPTMFSYVVKTNNGKGGIIRSWFATVRVWPLKDEVEITSVAPLRGRVGILYTYQVTATSSDSNAVLKYHLLNKPANMKIDTTGLIQWTPQKRGWFVATVEVTSSHGGSAAQNFSISVGLGNGIISGLVTDSTSGNPLKHVFIDLFEKDRQNHLEYHAITDSTGHYLIRDIDPGSYYVHAYSFNPHYLPQWYNNARFRSGATALAISDSTPANPGSTVNFMLLLDTLRMAVYKVSGSVADSLGTKLKGALVIWARADFTFNGSRFAPSDSTRAEGVRESLDPNNPLDSYTFSFDAITRWTYHTWTDSNGNYSMRVPRGYYVIRASKQGYYKLFYNNRTNILTADIFNLLTDTTQINFSLKSLPPIPLGDINGTVYDSSAQKGISARIIAFREWWAANDTIAFYKHYVTDTDSLGNYDLPELPPGQYFILAVPLGQYVPSYYTSSGQPTLRWSLATAITMAGSNISDIDIYVNPILNSSIGFTWISGTVSSTSVPGSIGKTSSSTANAVGGGMVYALDSADNVAGYGITDGVTGAYNISDLSPGTYTVMMDNSEYTTGTVSNITATYDASGNAVPATNVNIQVGSDIVTSVKAAVNISIPKTYSLEQNYPNPFNPTTQIRFNLPQTQKITLTVYNLLGQKVAIISDGIYQAGTHVVTWNGRNDQGSAVSTGVYFYQLNGQGFTITKKMILLK